MVDLSSSPLRTRDGYRVSRPQPAVSDRMRLVRRRNTLPEQAVRRVLRSLGVRYRICPPKLPGRPDIANRSHQWAVFVHGCFWHGHDNCSLATMPKTNRAFWTAKLKANRRRDLAKARALRSIGFRVLTVWQCELSQPGRLEGRLIRFLGARADSRQQPRRFAQAQHSR